MAQAGRDIGGSGCADNMHPGAGRKEFNALELQRLILVSGKQVKRRQIHAATLAGAHQATHFALAQAQGTGLDNRPALFVCRVNGRARIRLSE